MDTTRTIHIVIHPSGGKDQTLTVSDAMRQILDIVELMKAPDRQRPWPIAAEWGLVYASTNSPLTVQIAPLLPPAITSAALAAFDEDVQSVSVGVHALIENRALPIWMDKGAAETARRIAKRNTNGIGITELGGPRFNPVAITSFKSETIIEVLEDYLTPHNMDVGKHQSRGETSGKMIKVGEHYGKPAFWLQDKGGNEVVCTLSERLVELIGGETTLKDVWQNRRVTVRGIKHYDKFGKLLRLEALSPPQPLETEKANLDTIIDRDFTGGLSAADYIRKIRGEG